MAINLQQFLAKQLSDGVIDQQLCDLLNAVADLSKEINDKVTHGALAGVLGFAGGGALGFAAHGGRPRPRPPGRDRAEPSFGARPHGFPAGQAGQRIREHRLLSRNTF